MIIGSKHACIEFGWMEELHKTMSGAEGPTKYQRSKSKKMHGMTKGWERKGAI